MLLPTLLLLGNCLSFAPSPQFRLDLPEAEGHAEWYASKTGRADLYGDPLPEGAMARIGTTRFRPAGTIYDVAFSTDGRTLAATSQEGVYLLDAATGKPLARFTAPNAVHFNHVAFLPQGNYLVTHTYRGRILFWHLSPNLTRPLQGPETDQPSPFAMSSNGKYLAFTKDKTICLWDVTRGKEIDQLDRRESAYRLSFSADGKFLASLGGRRATLWDVPSGKALRHFPPKEEGDERKPLGRPEGHSIREFVLSPDGKILAGFRSPLNRQSGYLPLGDGDRQGVARPGVKGRYQWLVDVFSRRSFPGSHESASSPVLGCANGRDKLGGSHAGQSVLLHAVFARRPVRRLGAEFHGESMGDDDRSRALSQPRTS